MLAQKVDAVARFQDASAELQLPLLVRPSPIQNVSYSGWNFSRPSPERCDPHRAWNGYVFVDADHETVKEPYWVGKEFGAVVSVVKRRVGQDIEDVEDKKGKGKIIATMLPRDREADGGEVVEAACLKSQIVSMSRKRMLVKGKEATEKASVADTMPDMPDKDVENKELEELPLTSKDIATADSAADAQSALKPKKKKKNPKNKKRNSRSNAPSPEPLKRRVLPTAQAAGSSLLDVDGGNSSDVIDAVGLAAQSPSVDTGNEVNKTNGESSIAFEDAAVPTWADIVAASSSHSSDCERRTIVAKRVGRLVGKGKARL